MRALGMKGTQESAAQRSLQTIHISDFCMRDSVKAEWRFKYLCSTVLDEGLRGHNDDEVWSAAQAEGQFLVTQDLDFSNTQAGLSVQSI
jgi:predicted nuclease of predicted toxin-antitoxin system